MYVGRTVFLVSLKVFYFIFLFLFWVTLFSRKLYLKNFNIKNKHLSIKVYLTKIRTIYWASLFPRISSTFMYFFYVFRCKKFLFKVKL